MNNTTHTTTTSRRRLVAIAAIIALGTAASASTANAADAPKPGTTEAGLQLSRIDRERMERQQPLIAAADVIRAAVAEDVRANPLSGYSTIALGERSVILRWKGALPRGVDAAVERARQDVAVEVVAAKHTDAQLHAKVALIQQATKKLAGGAPFAVSIPAQGDKVRVEVESDVIAKVKTGLPVLDLPVEVTYGDVPKPAGRVNDTAPFYGGARLRNNSTGDSCTSGFAVSNWSGSGSYLVTAGHCGWPGAGFSNGDWSQPIGSATQEHVYYDLLLIPTSSAGYVFSGWSGMTRATKVNHWNYVYANEWVCTSGSFTEQKCGVQVDGVGGYCGYASYNVYECYGEMFFAYQRDGQRAVQGGDSGGPVYNYNYTAKGIISGANTSGTKVIFQDFFTVNQIWGVIPK